MNQKALFFILMLYSYTASSATITVDDSNGGQFQLNGLCSLTEAIEAANTDTAVGDCPAGDAGVDTIELTTDVLLGEQFTETGTSISEPGRIGLPAISSNLVIDGHGYILQRDSSLTCDQDDTSDPTEFRLILITSGGHLTLQNMTLKHGCVTDDSLANAFVRYKGGAVFVGDGGELDLINVHFENNSATQGGAIYVQDSGVIDTIDASLFIDNLATFSGGAVLNAGTINSALATQFTSNTADQGGGLYNQGVIGLLDAAVFTDNTAETGGGLFNNGSVTNILASEFTGNNANGNTPGNFGGGGLYNSLNQSISTIRNSVFTNNTATLLSGGGLYNSGLINTLADNVVANNTAQEKGAGIYSSSVNDAAINFITNNAFTNNVAIQDGGGLYNLSSIDVLSENTFSGNTTNGDGGAVFTDGTDSLGQVENNTFSGNTADSGAGIYNFAGTIDVVNNNTFANNSANSDSAINSASGFIGFMGNNLFYANSALTGDRDCSITVFAGGNNLTDDVNLDTQTSCGSVMSYDASIATTVDDLQDNGCLTALADGNCVQTHALQTGSAALDAASQGTATDQRGFANDGMRDVGAFELLSGATTCSNLGMETTADFSTTVSTAAQLNLAIFCANINLTSTDTITLTSDVTLHDVVNDDLTFGHTGTRVVKSPLVIEGTGHRLQRDAALACNLDGVTDETEFRILRVGAAGDLQLKDLTLAHGCVDGNVVASQFFGGAVFNSGTLLLAKTSIESNTANRGGGVYNEGAISAIRKSTLHDNQASVGGASFNAGTLSNLSNSTFSANTADFSGGAVANSGSIDEILSSTFSANSSNNGGAIANDGGTIVNLTNTLFHQNSATNNNGDCYLNGGTVTGSNNLSDRAASNCPGVLPVQLSPATLGNLMNNGCVNPPANGSCAPTHALLPGSEALNAASGGTATDQRGYPNDGLRDIGAFEAFTPVVIAPANAIVEATGPTTALPQNAQVTDIDEPELQAFANPPGPYALGDYNLLWTATDAQGFQASDSQLVRIEDTTGPAITLLGDDPIEIERGFTFNDPGATAVDLVDGDLSVQIMVTGTVDVNTAGTYPLQYNVSDLSGNAAKTVTRTVVVIDTCGPFGIDVSADFITTVASVDALNSALMCANLNTETSDTILLDADITLVAEYENDGVYGRTGTPPITSEVMLDGQGFALIRDLGLTCNLDSVSDPGEFRLLRVADTGSLKLRQITLDNGCVYSQIGDVLFYGGAVYNEGELQVDNSDFIRNSALFGGALNNAGDFTHLSRSTFSENVAIVGGGLFNTATGQIEEIIDSQFLLNQNTALANTGTISVISNCSFFSNFGLVAGGLFNNGTMTEIKNSAFYDNSSSLYGGALTNSENTISGIHNNTFANNTAQLGGAVYNAFAGGITTMGNNTFANNAAEEGGGLFLEDATINTFKNNLFLQNTATMTSQDDCDMTTGAISGINNMTDNASGGCPGMLGTTLSSASVGMLADNGCTIPLADGSCTMTHALLAGSEAIDQGTLNAANTDQRNFTANGIRDIGAFENGGINDVIFEDGFE